jgi:hypothetical protein
MSPKEYIENYYQKDLERFDEGILCGWSISKFCKPEERKKWKYLDHFLVCQYELNLLSELVYSSFQEDHNQWLKATLPYTDCRCASAHGGVSHPLSILWVAERDLSKNGPKFEIKKSLILEYDKYFMEYVKEICRKNKFNKLTPELLFVAVKNDPDCNNTQVRNYFNSKK